MKNPAEVTKILYSLKTTVESVKLKYRMKRIQKKKLKLKISCKVKLKFVINEKVWSFWKEKRCGCESLPCDFISSKEKNNIHKHKHEESRIVNTKVE